MIEDKQSVAIRLIYWLVIISITLAVSNFFLNRFPWEWPKSNIYLLMDGTANKPYVYRILVPFLVKGAMSIFLLSPQIYVSFITYFSLFGFVICIRSFSTLFWNSVKVIDFIGVVSPLLLIPLTLWNEQVNDFTTLLIFSLGLKLMAQAKWKWFFIVYIIGCLNKETIVLLSLIFFVCFRHNIRDKFFWKLLILQLVIYMAFRFSIIWVFYNNPGEVMENHFWKHISVIQTDPILVLIHLFFGILLIFLAVKDQHKKPFFLKQSAAILIPTLFILYLVGGFPLEIRIFYEAYPLVLLLILPTVCQLLGFPFWLTQYPGVETSQAVSLYAHHSPLVQPSKLYQ